MTDAIDISVGDHKLVLDLLKQHLPNVVVWAYGSRVKWTARPQSDLDLVAFTSCEQKAAVFNLREALEESSLPFPVDLFIWDELPESFRKRIEAEHVVLVEGGDQDVRSRWRKIPFAQLLSEPVRNGIYKKKEFHGRGVKIVNMGELFAYPRLRNVHMKRVELSDQEKHRTSVIKGDLLFARRSLVAEGAGKCSIVLEADESTTFESSIIRARLDPTKAYPLFLYYYFCSPLGLHALDSIRRQVAVAGITGSDLVQLGVLVPPLTEQRAIAHILGTLDDKIELNRRMNETLEEMARALFKSWFVDFDPVRAKMEGRDTGLPPDVADLFPDRLVESELGEIPEGWIAGNLGSYVEFQNGYAFKSIDWQNNGVPVVKIGSVKPGLVDLRATSCVSPETVVDLERFKLNPGDILVGMTGYPGETGLVPIHDPHPYLNQRVGRISAPQDHPENYAWIYAQVRNKSFKRHAEARAHGSAQANVSGRALLEYPVVFPGKALLKHYSDFATPLISRYLTNDAESRMIANLRDTLLPKLVSGELRVVESMGREGLYHYS